MHHLLALSVYFTAFYMLSSPVSAQDNSTSVEPIVYVQFQGKYLTIMHGGIQAILWLLIAPADLIIVRYFKVWYYWSHFHRNFMRVLTFTTCVFSVVNLAFDNPAYTNSPLKHGHSFFGILVTILIVIQFTLGMTFHQIMKATKPVRVFTIIKFAHRYLGYATYLCIFNNIALGIALAAPNLLTPLFIWYGFLLFVICVMEVWWRDPDAPIFQYLKQKVLRDVKKTHKISYGVKQYTSKQFDDMIKLGNNWCLLGDNIYDVKDLLKSHPGSRMLIKKAIGMDISKYFYGSEKLLSYYPAYSHSVHAEKLLQSLFCGVIKSPALLKIPRPVKSSESLNLPAVPQDQNMWKIVDKTRLSKNFWRLTLVSKYFLVNNSPKGVDWVAKYMKVSFMMDGAITQRHYCFVPYLTRFISVMKKYKQNPPNKPAEELQFLLNPEISGLHMSSRTNLKSTNKIFMEDEAKGMEVNEKKNFQEELYLYIRKHKFGSSEVLLNNELGLLVEVLGPMGKSPDFLEYNNVCMFAAGCSILGFCDAIFLFYQMIVKELKGMVTVKELIKAEQKRFSDFSEEDQHQQLVKEIPPRRMTIFLTMKCPSDFEGLGLGFLEKVHWLAQKSQNFTFDYYVTFTDNKDAKKDTRCGSGRFSKEFIQEKFPMGAEKVFISGCSEFKKHLTDYLLEVGMPFPMIELL